MVKGFCLLRVIPPILFPANSENVLSITPYKVPPKKNFMIFKKMYSSICFAPYVALAHCTVLVFYLHLGL